MGILWGSCTEADHLFLRTAWRGTENPLVLSSGSDAKVFESGRIRHYERHRGKADQSFSLSPLQGVNLLEAVLMFVNNVQAVPEVIRNFHIILMQVGMASLCSMDLVGSHQEPVDPRADHTDMADCKFRAFLRLSYMVVLAQELPSDIKRHLLGQMACALLQLRIEAFASVD